MPRRIGRIDQTPQTTIRVSVTTRDQLKLLLEVRAAQYRAHYSTQGGRQYGEPAFVTMDDIVRELLRDSGALRNRPDVSLTVSRPELRKVSDR